MGFGGHLGRHLENKTMFEWSDFCRLFVFAAYTYYTRVTENANRYNLSLLRNAHFS